VVTLLGVDHVGAENDNVAAFRARRAIVLFDLFQSMEGRGLAFSFAIAALWNGNQSFRRLVNRGTSIVTGI
jgi:hypothetical protein